MIYSYHGHFIRRAQLELISLHDVTYLQNTHVQISLLRFRIIKAASK